MNIPAIGNPCGSLSKVLYIIAVSTSSGGRRDTLDRKMNTEPPASMGGAESLELRSLSLPADAGDLDLDRERAVLLEGGSVGAEPELGAGGGRPR